MNLHGIETSTEAALPTSERESMDYYIQKVRGINDKKTRETGKRPVMVSITYGCQMNAHDSEKIIGMLCEMGYEQSENQEDADIIIYNTCCIRENAENKIYGNLGYMKSIKRRKKGFKVILCGCMMQQDTVLEKIKKSYPFVDIIFGTYNLYRFPRLLYTNMETGSQIIDIWQEQKEIVEDLPAQRKSPFKASVNIMYGCNNYCTYCIVPYVRGRERSREVEDILNEIRALAQDGVKEIVLLGQNVNSYGKTLKRPVSFAGLLSMAAKVPGIERIRFMTSHPKDFSDELIQVIREHDNICKHIHLPIQSGSSAILKRMNRYYNRDQYLSLVDRIKAAIPDIALTTDIIVGFPGETDADNEETIDILKKVQYASAFTFIYSKRSGTPAAAMENQVDETVAKKRFNKILAVLNPLIYEGSKAQVGATGQVLVEGFSNKDEGIVTGRLDNNSLVHFKGSKDLIGTIVDVQITDCKTFYLLGQLC